MSRQTRVIITAMRLGPPLFVVVGCAAAAGIVLAQGTATRPILHEDLPPLSADKASPAIMRGGSMPTAIAAGDKLLPKPSLDTSPRTPGEPVLGTNGFAADRQTSMKPDDNTGPDGTLHYVSVFNPDVLPFKRMSAFDQVGDDYTLHVARTVLTEIPVGGRTDPKTRDWFFGDVLIQLKPGVDVPLPSVAPDMRVLSYEVKPRIALHFSKDGADNFYVRTDESNASGQYRLLFYVDADARYFAPALPATKLKVRDVIAQASPEIKPLIPPQVRNAAKQTLEREVHADQNYDLAVAFNNLVGYFRAFQAGDIGNASGDIYRDLCDSQKGVCRHRSFAFMVTANTLGIPTRYVQNEAHAFVEVWFPQRGWQRIDLGGAALRMDVQGADNKTLHRPRAEDPFAKPPQYKNQYTRLEGEIRGLTDQQKADKKKSLDQAPASGQIAQTGGGSGSGGGQASGPDRMTPDPNAPVKEEDPKKTSPELMVTTADTSAYRGEFLHVEGVARAKGKGLGNFKVDIHIAPAGRSGASATKIGYGVTRPDGTFSADVAIPGSIDLARYEIFLTSEEDPHFNPAKSQ